MKKILSLALMAVLPVALIGCPKDRDPAKLMSSSGCAADFGKASAKSFFDGGLDAEVLAKGTPWLAQTFYSALDQDSPVQILKLKLRASSADVITSSVVLKAMIFKFKNGKLEFPIAQVPPGTEVSANQLTTEGSWISFPLQNLGTSTWKKCNGDLKNCEQYAIVLMTSNLNGNQKIHWEGSKKELYIGGPAMVDPNRAGDSWLTAPTKALSLAFSIGCP